MPRRGALGALLLGAVAIAFAPIFVRLSELGPSATAFYRLAFALPALWAWALVDGAPTEPLASGDGRWLVIAGLCFAGDLATWHWAIRFTSVANATLLANLAPIFVTAGAWPMFGERVTPLFTAGMVTALLGMSVLMGASAGLSGRHLLGDGLGVVAAVFYAGYMLAVKGLRVRLSTPAIMARSGAVTCAALLPAALLSGESLVAHDARGWAVLIGLALVAQVGGQSLIAYALAHLGAGFSSVGLLLQPVVAAGLAWVILAEPFGVRQALGGVVVLAGIFVASRSSLRPGRSEDHRHRL
jgi:drug/metabolite transporter (DMT)-like permease